MFKIREFAQLGQVSVKALRFYDQLGLLKPAHTDRWTGYRFYTAAQLLQLNRILAYKELGFTLDQIARLLDEQLSCEQIRGMFRLKQAQVEGLIASEQQRLNRLAARLRQIEYNDAADPQQDVVIKRLAPQWAASLRRHTSPAALPDMRADLESALRQGGRAALPTLPYLVLWHGCEACEDAVDMELAYPIANCTLSRPGVTMRELPAVDAAATLRHRCTPGEVCSVSATLAAWIEANDYAVVADQPRRELYLAADEHGGCIAEVQIPIALSTGTPG